MSILYIIMQLDFWHLAKLKEAAREKSESITVRYNGLVILRQNRGHNIMNLICRIWQ